MNLKILDRSAIDALVNARTPTQAWSYIREILKPYGFEYLLYGTNRLSGEDTFGKRTDTYFLSDLPEQVMQLLWNNEHYRSAPIAIWAMKNDGALSFGYGSQLYHSGQLPEDQHATQEALMRAGVTSGYVIGFNPPETTIATALALVNFKQTQEEADLCWDSFGDIIQTYASIFNLRMSNLPIPMRTQGLRSRQREVLHWVAHGKTSAEVATILGLSTATIEKHLRQARETLGVSTTTQAVLYAQINNHIFTSKPNAE